MSLYKIANKFFEHLASLERFLDYHETIKEKYTKKEKEEFELGDFIDIMLDVKFAELVHDSHELTDLHKSKKDLIDQGVAVNPTLKYFYENVEVQQEGEV